MDTITLAAITLALTTIVFAALAERQRRIARRTQAALDQALARAGEHRKLAYNDGLFDGWKRGWSESYTAACKADRQGRSPIEAIHRVGEMNAPALLDAPADRRIAA